MCGIDLSVVEMIIGIGGFILALYTNELRKRQSKTHKAVLEIQKRQEKERIEESKKAKLTAELEPMTAKYSPLIIRNIGKAEARNVRVSLSKHDLDHKGPFEFIASECAVVLRVVHRTTSIGREFHGYATDPFVATLTWDDDLGKDHSCPTTLIPG